MKWRAFITYNSIAAGLLLSWFFPLTRIVWDFIDENVFYYLNSSLAGRPLVQIFWALANVKLTDLFGAFLMSIFMLLYVFDGKGSERKERLAQFFFILIWFEVGIFFTKEILSLIIQATGGTRESPSLVLENPIMLSEAIPWLKVKDLARSSFPGDHAEILLQWTAYVWFFCGIRYGILASIWAVFFIIPRLIAGAHWFSDAIVGSMSIVFIVLAFSTATPLYDKLMKILRIISGKILALTYEQPLSTSH